jgi:hypothetical protein
MAKMKGNGNSGEKPCHGGKLKLQESAYLEKKKPDQ